MNKSLKINLLALFTVTMCLTACKKEYEGIKSVDDRAIQTYLAGNSQNFTKDSTGYYYTILNPGSGDILKNSDSVFYSYTFKLLNGLVIEKTSDFGIPGSLLGYTDRLFFANRPFLFTPVREVYARLKRGGKATLIMPSNQAFGKNGFSALNIGSNENILVDLSINTGKNAQEINQTQLGTFLSTNNLTPVEDSTGVRYIVSQQGTGDPVLASSTLSINYTGRLLDGTVFESTNGTPISLALAQSIQGWEILKKFNTGSKVRLFIPSNLAYGPAGSKNSAGVTVIPPNAVLDFDIEIVSVK